MIAEDNNRSTFFQPITNNLARDLPDFLLRWHDYKLLAQEILRRPDLTDDETELLRWLMALADRAGPRDLE